MRNRDRIVRMYDLHSWSGVILGFLLFVICFTGSVAMFARDEVKSWENPALRLAVAETPLEMTETLDNWVSTKSQGQEIAFLRFLYPSVHSPVYIADMDVRLEDGTPLEFKAMWDTENGEPVQIKKDGFSYWLLEFHRNLMFPDFLGGKFAGRIFVGLTGVMLLLTLISGIIAHTKITQEFFTLRYWRSVRLMWQDTHKVIGLWTAPFSAIIGFTGIALGMGPLVFILVGAMVFEGDVDTASVELGMIGTDPAGISAQMLTVDEIRDFSHPVTGNAPSEVQMQHYGDVNAEYVLLFPPKGELKPVDIMTVSGVTGDPIQGDALYDDTPANRTLMAMNPLHYGTFGGVFMKIVYFVLGLFLSLIISLGTMMWIERRKNGNEGNRSDQFYDGLTRINIGISLGFPLASVALFHTDKLLFTGPGDYVVAIGWAYFVVFAGSLLYAFLRRDDYRATLELTALCGIACLTVPLVNFVATGDWFLSSLTAPSNDWAWVDFFMASMGVVLLYTAVRLPKHRPSVKHEHRQIEASA